MRYTLAADTLQNMPILLPSLDEQKRIGNIFSMIDRKIALNRALNHNLEAIAKQLYDYWFVQFDFPNADGKPYKSSGGKMVGNAKLKRYIPEGWEVTPIFEEFDILYGYPFSTDSFTEGTTSVPVVRIRDIIDGTISAYTTEITDSKYQLSEGDLVIGMDGNFHMNIWADRTAYLNQRCVRIRKKNIVLPHQSLYALHPYIKAREASAKGSTVGHLSDKDMKELAIIKASTELQTAFNSQIEPLTKQIIRNRQEVLNLVKMRDELLPLLMNGQVSVNYDLAHD